ncbi:hypothetical protein [Staphylococcus phage SAP6]|nr:hypothetical protein [Staphylococcus phage StAP1]WAW12260.1 hypothetical protein [Staphylococcus phage SAP6]
MNNKQLEQLYNEANRVLNKDIDGVSYVNAHRMIKDFLDLPIENKEKRETLKELYLILNKFYKVGE